MTIAIGGFQHETNTFAPTKTTFERFAEGGGWPALARGEALFAAVAGINLPVAGFIDTARGRGHALAPLCWCAAPPAAHVTADAFERVTAMICEDLAAIRGLDAVYLDLHGAMVTEDHEDGEGEILRRVRAVVGNDIPVVASLDLHANVTDAMMSYATTLIAYRTYPHIDMAETGGRVAQLLGEILRRGRAPAKAMRKLPFLLPLTSQCTMFDPLKSVYSRLDELTTGDVASVSFTPGFAPADIRECGPAVLAYGWSDGAAEDAAQSLYDEICAQEGDFELDLLSADDSVARALANRSDRPVVLADTQDNPGAGANADTVWLIDSLVRQRATGAVVALVFDPDVAAQAKAAGEGAVVDLRLGAWSGLDGHAPYAARFEIERVADGVFTATGPMWLGSRMKLGPMALLRVVDGDADVRVIVSSRKMQAGDQSIFRHVGIEPAEQRILVLKSSVHFRADFEDLAAEVLVVAAPGPNAADPATMPYRNLREGVRLNPLGAPFRLA